MNYLFLFIHNQAFGKHFKNFHTLKKPPKPQQPTSLSMATTAPLITIPVMEKIETFVEDIPSDVLAFHGGVDQLTTKVTDLIFPPPKDVSQITASEPTDTEVTEAPKKRGRPKGSKNKSKDVPVETDQAPKKRGRPKGSKNKNKIQ